MRATVAHPQRIANLIALDAVWRYYETGHTRLAALRHVSLTIESGSFVAVWGPSGSGKSTLCNLLGMVDLPSSGRVLVNGRNVAEMTDNERCEHRNRAIGIIFQQFNLVPVLDAVENVMIPLQIRGVNDTAARNRAAAILDELGLSAFAGHRPDKLSGGQQQRVAIARALVTAPPIVIADEPTANLDSENALRIVGIMRRFNRAHGTTFVFSTHDQRLLDHVARRICLRDGAITADTAADATAPQIVQAAAPENTETP